MNLTKGLSPQASDLLRMFRDVYPESVTTDEGLEVLGWRPETPAGHRKWNQYVNETRSFLGFGSTGFFIPCVPNGQGQKWLFSLVHEKDATKEQVIWWVRWRIRCMKSQTRTLLAGVAAASNSLQPGDPGYFRLDLAYANFSRGLEDLEKVEQALIDAML